MIDESTKEKSSLEPFLASLRQVSYAITAKGTGTTELLSDARSVSTRSDLRPRRASQLSEDQETR